MGSTFVKASAAIGLDNRTGYSDPESRVGRAVKTRNMSCRLHLTVDAKSEMPVAMTVASGTRTRRNTL